MGFHIPKIWQILSVLLGQFIKHKALISEEECNIVFNTNKNIIIPSQLQYDYFSYHMKCTNYAIYPHTTVKNYF